MHPRYRALLPVIAAVVMTASACSTAQKTPEAKPPGAAAAPTKKGVSPGDPEKEAQEFAEIQALYQSGAYEAAAQKLAAFESKHPKSQQLPNVLNLHGMALLLLKQPNEAVPRFKAAIERSPSPSFRQFVLYNLASAQFELSQLNEVQQTLTEINPDLMDRENQVKFHLLRAQLYARMGLMVEAARELLGNAKPDDSPATLKQFGTQLRAVLQQFQDTEQVEKILDGNEDSPIADHALYALAARALEAGQISKAEKSLNELLNEFEDSEYKGNATEMVGSLESRTMVDSSAVGVLLPMTGKYSKFGSRSLQGIAHAFQIFDGAAETDSKLSLVVEDSGEEPEQAIRALETLYFKHKVVAVIGPLMSKGIDQVTKRAQELGVPLLSLTQQSGTPGDSVFQAGITPEMQAQELARHAIEKLGIKRFAIVHPQDSFGERYSQYFWDAVESRGGSVTGVESYRPGETDFRQTIDRLAGLHYTEARQRELDGLTQQRTDLNIKKRNRRTEQYFALKPIIDFEAVFIPDEPKSVGQILPTFAYRDIDGMRFLGTSTWHSKELVTRAQNFAENSVLVDAYFTESADAAVQKFISQYSAAFGQEPTYIEAVSYDTAAILKSVILSDDARSRSAVRERLKIIDGFPGVTGKISYRDGQFARTLKILTIQNGKFSELR